MEKRRANGLYAAGEVAHDPVVKTTVDERHNVKKRVVEDVDDGVGFLNGRGLLLRRGARAHQRVDLLQHVALVLDERRAAQTRMLVKKLCNAADLALDGFAARLGGMRGEHGVELELAQKSVCLLGADLFKQLVVGNRELVGGVDDRVDVDRLLALAQLAHAVVLLGEVREVEKRREGADHHLRLVVRELVDELDRVTERRRTGRIGDGHTLVIDRLVGGVGAGVALVCVDYAVEKLVE